MKERRNIFKKLEEEVPKELSSMIQLLFDELKEFFQNMSLYEHNEIYIQLFNLLYDSSKKRYTNIEISDILHIDVKIVKKFINKIEEFVPNYIAVHRRFSKLKVHMHKK